MKKNVFLIGALSLAIVLSACTNKESTEEKKGVETKNDQSEQNSDITEGSDQASVMTTNDFFEPHGGNLGGQLPVKVRFKEHRLRSPRPVGHKGL